MPVPQVGDIMIRDAGEDTFLLTDGVTGRLLAGPFRGYMVAIGWAWMRGARVVWQQNMDKYGRPLGDPFKLP